MHKRQEGTLWKWTNYWSGWQPRWFVLNKGTLSYYKSQDEIGLGCKGAVNVAAAEITAHPSDAYRLDVVVPGEVNFYLRAGSPHERQDWLVALGSVKSCSNTEKASKGLVEEEQMKRKSSELRLYCDLLTQQVHSIKTLVIDSPVPDVKQLDENTALLSDTCDTFIRTLNECMKLNSRPAIAHSKPPPSPLASPTTGRSSLPLSSPRTRTKPPVDFVTQVSSDSVNAHEMINGNDGTNRKEENVPTFFTEMEMSFSRITLGEDGSVPTDAFLRCCSSLVRILDCLGASSFTSVKMDLNANLRKLTVKYETNPAQYETLQRLVGDEVERGTATGPNSATESLTWTTRSLKFIRQFLSEYEKGEPDLAKICADAYSCTLRPFHDWVIRGVFTIACKSAVSRDQFTGSLAVRREDVGTESFQRQLRSDIISCVAGIDRCLRAVDKLYSMHDLDARTLAD